MRTLLKFPDFILLGIALPIFLLTDLPITGWIVAAIGWFVQALVIGYMEQRAVTATEPRHQVGFVVGGSLARAWLAAAAILVAYLIGGDDAGLSCALLMIALFSIYFLNKMFIHLIRPADKA
ncbi:MAG: hypothetical protein QM648_11705 [Solirubrobacterales bacterium]